MERRAYRLLSGMGLVLALQWTGCGQDSSSEEHPGPANVPQSIEKQAAPVQQPVVGIDRQGRGLAIWIQDDQVWTNRYTASNGWGTETRLATPPAGTHISELGGLSLAVSPNGRALAAWIQSRDAASGGGMNVWTVNYSPDGGWRAPQAIHLATGWEIVSHDLKTAVNDQGQAAIAWLDGIGPTRELYAAYSASGQTWQVDSIAHHTSLPSLAIGSDGTALLLWISASPNQGIYLRGSRSQANSAWSTPELVQVDAHPDFESLQAEVAFDEAGSALAVWTQSRRMPLEVTYSILARRFDPATGWKVGQSLVASITDPFLVELAAEHGRPMVVWKTYDEIRSSIETATGVWSASELVKNNPDPRVDLTVVRTGTGAVLASLDEGLVLRRYKPGSGWGEELRPDAQAFGSLAIAPFASGDALVLWPRRVGEGADLFGLRLTAQP